MEHAQVAHAAAAAAAAGREGEVDRSIGEEGQAAITMAAAADVVVVASSSPRLSGQCRPSSPAFPSPNTEETVRFPPPALSPPPPPRRCTQLACDQRAEEDDQAHNGDDDDAPRVVPKAYG